MSGYVCISCGKPLINFICSCGKNSSLWNSNERKSQIQLDKKENKEVKT